MEVVASFFQDQECPVNLRWSCVFNKCPPAEKKTFQRNFPLEQAFHKYSFLRIPIRAFSNLCGFFLVYNYPYSKMLDTIKKPFNRTFVLQMRDFAASALALASGAASSPPKKIKRKIFFLELQENREGRTYPFMTGRVMRRCQSCNLRLRGAARLAVFRMFCEGGGHLTQALCFCLCR